MRLSVVSLSLVLLALVIASSSVPCICCEHNIIVHVYGDGIVVNAYGAINITKAKQCRELNASAKLVIEDNWAKIYLRLSALTCTNTTGNATVHLASLVKSSENIILTYISGRVSIYAERTFINIGLDNITIRALKRPRTITYNVSIKISGKGATYMGLLMALATLTKEHIEEMLWQKNITWIGVERFNIVIVSRKAFINAIFTLDYDKMIETITKAGEVNETTLKILYDKCFIDGYSSFNMSLIAGGKKISFELNASTNVLFRNIGTFMIPPSTGKGIGGLKIKIGIPLEEIIKRITEAGKLFIIRPSTGYMVVKMYKGMLIYNITTPKIIAREGDLPETFRRTDMLLKDMAVVFEELNMTEDYNKFLETEVTIIPHEGVSASPKKIKLKDIGSVTIKVLAQTTPKEILTPSPTASTTPATSTTSESSTTPTATTPTAPTRTPTTTPTTEVMKETPTTTPTETPRVIPHLGLMAALIIIIVLAIILYVVRRPAHAAVSE